ncbi:MAG TPA: tRNA threonylcarbamoyladenosine dehydratase [Thermoanaerobacterales bacterium]|nr:tRNA threonylcarbamoyladenosine dehydratase [Thermoanaerobacterales bacterium]
MQHRFSRSQLLIGDEGLKKLKKSKVAVIGIGGVGSFAVEALARAGIGELILVDDDVICITNINRQIHALESTVGLPKVEVMKKRILDINPNAHVTCFKDFYSEENADKILAGDIDYVVDAIDTIKSKVDLIIKCKKLNIPIISSMGAGNKLDPTLFRVADISQTSVCPMARVLRKELKKHGILKGVKVVFSTERPVKTVQENLCKTRCICPRDSVKHCNFKRSIPGSISYVPSVAGLIMAGEVIRDILNI